MTATPATPATPISTFAWKERLKAAGIHLSLSLLVATLAAAIVFGVWYPYPYREIAGGRELFFLLITVDVILGPLITFAVFNRKKPWTELRRDLAIVGLLQLSALGYGMWTVFVARPVHSVFEIDRFRVIHAIDVPEVLLSQTPANIDALPLTGPTLLGMRPFRDNNESMEATMLALRGLALGARPDFWQPYAQSRADVLRVAKPLATLKARPALAPIVDTAMQKLGRSNTDGLVYLPLVARKTFWTMVLDAQTADVVAYLPIDPY